MKRNEKGQFVKGMTPWNVGKKYTLDDHANKTSFKTAKQHPRYRPIGSERINKNDHVEIKIAERQWMTKHRHLWELKNGKMPKNHVVIFANGNRRDFSEENLLLVSRAQLMSMNKNKLIKNDAELTKTGVAIADLLLMTGRLEKERRA
jgi:hypothetical protein